METRQGKSQCKVVEHITTSSAVHRAEIHTARCDTIFVQFYMDAPPEVPGVSKNHIFSLIKLLRF